MIYAIDRFEEDKAVLCDEEETCVVIDRAELPAEAREGDMLRLENDVYTVDTVLTEQRRARVRALEQRLKQRNGGTNRG